MFGTERAIKDFQLCCPVRDQTEGESCSAWGTVSYTDEGDFREETFEDTIVFSLIVRPETFARYVAKISLGAADEIILRVGMVAGFYSEWTPAISTRDVKVLASGEEQKITMPPGVEFQPPRLGRVGEAALYSTESWNLARLP